MTLQELLDRCKAGVYLTVNQHRDYYQTAEVYLAEQDQNECPPQIEPAVRAEMIRLNTIVCLQFYPYTPIGSYEVYHYTVEGALADAALCFADDRGTEHGT